MWIVTVRNRKYYSMQVKELSIEMALDHLLESLEWIAHRWLCVNIHFVQKKENH